MKKLFERGNAMKTMSFIKGMGAGLIVGACAGMMMAPEKSAGKKKVGKMMKTIGGMIEDFTDSLGF